MSAPSFTEQLQGLKRKFEISLTDPEAKQVMLKELDNTIESLKVIRASLAKSNSADAGVDCAADIDADLEDLFRPYDTKLSTFLESSGQNNGMPLGYMDAKLYKKQIGLHEDEITKAQKSADTVRSSIKEKKQALEEQLRLLENRATILGQPMNQKEMNQYTQAIENAESQLSQIENSLMMHMNHLWHLVHTVNPIDGMQFKERFIALFTAKLALMAQARKAEADAML
jgi:hypothetical protein